jgi:transglutaminase-like putative cysteine protease
MTFLDRLKKMLGCQEAYWKEQYDSCGKQLSSALNEMLSLKNTIENLKSQLVKDDSKIPSWLDTAQYVYTPKIALPEGLVELLDPCEIYASNNVLKGICQVNLQNKSLDEKLIWIWYFVIDALTYMYDVNEDWQFPIVTYYKKKGDCEDGTILFVEICKQAGIKADSVFNCCGWFTQGTQKFGHSFPIAKMQDGKFYVFETTIDYHPRTDQLVLFKGSPYDASWGLCNHRFKGKIINGDQI